MRGNLDSLTQWFEELQGNHEISAEDTYSERFHKGNFRTSAELLREILNTDSIMTMATLCRTLMESHADLRTIMKADDSEKVARKYIQRGQKLLLSFQNIDLPVRSQGKQKRIFKAESTIDGKTIIERISVDDRTGAALNIYDFLCHFTHANMTRFTLQDAVEPGLLYKHALITAASSVLALLKYDFFTQEELLALLAREINTLRVGARGKDFFNAIILREVALKGAVSLKK